jgi:hypothetical protein
MTTETPGKDMDRYQATASEQLTQLRSQAAARYADAILTALARDLFAREGKASLERFRSIASDAAAVSRPMIQTST